MKTKRIISILLVSLMLFTTMQPFSVFAEAENAVIMVESVSAAPGATVDVVVTIENNPGILGASVKLEYDSGLTLIGATNGEAFSPLTFSKPGQFTSPCNFGWDGQELSVEQVKDGTILTLQFKVNDNAESGDEYDVELSYEPGDIVDFEDLQPITVDIVNGVVSVVDYMPGDLNDDDKVNMTDVILLRRHIVGGYEQTINESAADVNNDQRRNMTDAILIRRYIVGGYDVELLPSKPTCSHNMEAIEYKAPSCTEAGNIAYWHCTICNKYYSDENGTSETTLISTVLEATGHTVVIDEAVEPTYDNTGLTEGKHCSVCDAVIVAQEVIPKLEKNEYAITYYIHNNDSYLESIAIENPNPSTYAKEDGLVLQDLIVKGYNFKGWFTAQTGGTQVTKIEAGETSNKTLYAHWEKVTYIVSFACDMVLPGGEISDITYTVDKEYVLPKPTMDKYTFIGWTDKSGQLWTSIPEGTTGNINLYANWASNRNKAIAKEKLEDPFIIEDTDNGLILFTYEIGEIQNVPLFTTLKLNCVNGIISTTEVTKTSEISDTQASSIAQSISNATTNSSSWALSSDWNETTEVSESYLEETGKTREEAETLAKTESNTYFLNSSKGGTSDTITVDGTSYKHSGNVSGSTTNGQEIKKGEWLSSSASLTGGLGNEKSIAHVSGTASISGGNSGELTANTSGTNSWADIEDQGTDHSTTSSQSSNWNTTSGFENSKSTSQSTTISNIISQVVSQQKGYGETYSTGGSNSESQAFASSNTQNDEYSSTMTYYTSKIESTTTSFSSTGNTIGDYRMVVAGTVHVFAVVGYDIASGEYFVYTYNILGDGSKDDGTYEYLDYSFDGTFKDYETTIIPFEVPYFVNEYVTSRIAKTDGLLFDPDTGIIEDYIPKADTNANVVVIPSYIVVDNNDGTFSAEKVTGIAPGLFKNNTTIKAVQLGRFITEIPDSAFEGCSSLEYLLCPGVTEIGNSAFSGCTVLESFTLPVEITSLGENAFESVPEVKAVASNVEVAQAVAACGAGKVVLDISSIPDEENSNLEFVIGEIELFELQGKDKEYKGLSLKSDAAKTVINGVTITENTKIPLEISSEEVVLDRVTVEATGFALALKAEDTSLLLNRTINIRSLSGNAVLCKNINLAPLTTGIVGKLNVTGNVLVCGEITNDKYLTLSDGEIKYITAEEFENYLSSHKISFDANGGTVSVKSKLASLNMPIGELPVPSRDYYSFDGWYTEAEGGEQVTEETLMTALTDITLYAHWTHNDATWAIAAEVPEDAEIVDRKYTYTQTLYTTSNSSSLSGWTQYKSERTAWGATVGPVYSNPANGTRNVWTEQYVTSTTTHYKYYHRYVNSSTWGSDSTAPNSARHSAPDITYQLSPSSKYGTSIQFYGSLACSTCGAKNMWIPDGTYSTNNYGTRWYYQEPVYTYYFSKTEDRESQEDPSANADVSNVVEWVQYRTK